MQHSPPPPIPACPAPTSLLPTKIDPQAEIPSAQSGWEPFFLPDMAPTLTYTTLANEIFTYLDPQNAGILLPETLSHFLDDMGYLPDENYWKNGSKASLGTNDPDISILCDRDKALKNIFDLFSIEHHLLPRPSVPQSSPSMPAITRKGFIDVTSIDLLIEPSHQWEKINCLLRKYNLPIYQRWGDLPRSVLPSDPEQGMLARVMSTAAIAKQKILKNNGIFSSSVEEQFQMELRMIELQSHDPDFLSSKSSGLLCTDSYSVAQRLCPGRDELN
ncbi:hypothetical protein C0993_010056 [Termitomyces sp. T159_Od127]|nr:hypothetical protein C0993_010056 [Termitomyces sp. T159_Od127]